jgi:hypothetical protein
VTLNDYLDSPPWYAGYPRYFRPADRYTIYDDETGKVLGALMPDTNKPKTLSELLVDAGWQPPQVNPFAEPMEKTARDQLKAVGWEEPEPEWQYYTAITNHVHGWGCKADTPVDWQAEYFLSVGGMGRIKGRTAHKHGVVQLRKREDFSRNMLIVQLGYEQCSTSPKAQWVTITSQAHNR